MLVLDCVVVGGCCGIRKFVEKLEEWQVCLMLAAGAGVPGDTMSPDDQHIVWGGIVLSTELKGSGHSGSAVDILEGGGGCITVVISGRKDPNVFKRFPN